MMASYEEMEENEPPQEPVFALPYFSKTFLPSPNANHVEMR
jgi:hypothetical protein